MKGKRVFFINELNFESKNAGYKARNDILNIIKRNNSVSVINLPLWGSAIKRIMKIPLFIYYYLFLFNRGDLIILQYPFPKPFIKWSNLISRIKGIDICFIIHDVDILRGQNCNEDILNLNAAKFNITHNKKMTQELKILGVNSYLYEIDIFDYKLDANRDAREIKSDTIIFCGNLNKEKSGFIYDWITEDIDKIVYGVNQSEDINNNNKYMGSFDANNPPDFKNIDGARVFGLVWDGPSTDGCIGGYGDYLRYNNPHKTSLYLAMGIPIIIWNHSAIFEFLKEKNCAIGVDSLENIPEIIKSLTDDEYQVMSSQANYMKDKITSGIYTSNVINKVLGEWATR